MLRNYFGMHFYNFLFLLVEIIIVCSFIQDFNFVFKVHEVFQTNLMNYSQLVVYEDKPIRNHLIRLIPIFM